MSVSVVHVNMSITKVQILENMLYKS